MKKRLFSIMDTSRKSKWLAMACGVAVISTTILSGNAFAASSGTGQYIGEDKAKSIALEYAGISEQQTTFIKAYLNYDDGHVVYDVEFYSGSTEYDYEIDAVNGDILEYDREIEHYIIPKASTKGNKTSGQSAQQTASSSTTGQYIGEAKAKSIALSDAGLSESQVHKMKVELDCEDGRMVYEVEFKNGQMEYEYEIDAMSGIIHKSDVEYDD